jgi:predicted metalloprotease
MTRLRLLFLPVLALVVAVLAVAAPAGALAVPGATSSKDDLENFLTSTLRDVDGYWTKVFEHNDLGEPTVRYAWIPEGRAAIDGCSGQPTDETAAFYCPADDTIYLAEPFAVAVRDGRLSRWPSGDRTDGGLGDMAVAYVIAHEEAHNIQHELGLFDGRISTERLELHADCLAGAWAGNAASRGVVDDRDLEEAKVTAWLVGDYAFDDPGHHGTPRQRAAAFTAGYDDLESCFGYLG